MSAVDLAQARVLDLADPLRGFRARFALPAGVIYLDGNSLGPLPEAARARLAHAVRREWGEGLIRSWNEADWIGAPGRVGGKIAPLIGAAATEVVVSDSTSVNLFKLLLAALRARPGRRAIVAETGDFPTDGYIAQGVAGMLPDVELRAVPRQEVSEAIDGETALVLLSHVHYKTAERHDMAAITSRAHAGGALALWDLSHSAGAIRVELSACEVDLAVGCGYKYLNGGPGAPAFLFVADRLQGELDSPLTGWMGHAQPFDFEDGYRAAPGIGRFLCGTPPVLSLLALEAGIDLMAEADLRLIEEKSARLWDLFAARMDARCGDFGFTLLAPRDPARRGSHIAFRHPEGYRIVQALIARGVIGDFRDPDVLRFGLTPLYLGYEDVWRAVEMLRDVMAAGFWRETSPRAAGRVT
ncbi:MAG: kynureninase [Caulobacteraceae bacterium]